jgi:hypothetical protein
MTASDAAGAAADGPASRPEQTFFDDPALDRAAGMIMTLAAEVWVLRDRMAAMQALLEESGALAPGALDAWQPDAETTAALDADRRDFVRHLMDNVLAQQQSKGAP